MKKWAKEIVGKLGINGALDLIKVLEKLLKK
jgi:hypothetical protein